jgi:hypothetical protein
LSHEQVDLEATNRGRDASTSGPTAPGNEVLMQAQPNAPLYPEHEKLLAIAEQSQAVGEFLEMGGYTLCTYREAGDNGEPRFVWPDGSPATRQDYIFGEATMNPARDEWSEGYVPTMKNVQAILAEWFEIDLDAIEHEKHSMLEAIRRG